MMNYRVTIEDRDEEAERPLVVSCHDDLSWAVANAIKAAGPVRIDEVVAGIVDALMGGGGLPANECWPGYREQYQALVDAAEAIRLGWRQHDEDIRNLPPATA